MMFFCETCGQSPLINGDHFIEIRNTSGWESNWIDAHDGEYIEYIDGETTDGDHASYECPRCNSSAIDSMWEGTEEEALARRDEYEQNRKEENQRFKKANEKREYELKAKDPLRKWDVETNV